MPPLGRMVALMSLSILSTARASSMQSLRCVQLSVQVCEGVYGLQISFHAASCGVMTGIQTPPPVTPRETNERVCVCVRVCACVGVCTGVVQSCTTQRGANSLSYSSAVHCCFCSAIA